MSCDDHVTVDPHPLTQFVCDTGIKMSTLKSQCVGEAHILNVTGKSILTSQHIVKVSAIDIRTELRLNK